MKFIINSHILYSKPLDIALKSLANTNYDFSDIPIIVIYGGDDKEIEPLTNDYIINDRVIKIITIHTKLNNYDYTGLSMLYRYKDHPLVIDDFYFYSHDTVIFGSKFYNNIKKYADEIINQDEYNILMNVGHNSNVMLFKKDLILSYQNNFDHTISKKDAVLLEINKYICTFGKTKYLSSRVFVNNEDIYHTGHRRAKYHYQEFDLFKYIFLHYYGDITNDVRSNF